LAMSNKAARIIDRRSSGGFVRISVRHRLHVRVMQAEYQLRELSRRISDIL
jgi:hypothetical protein